MRTSNLDRFLQGSARRKSSFAATIRRETFTHRGREYVAIRFRGGRVELYRVECDGYTETFMRYAIPRNGGLDDAAIWAVQDHLDVAAKMARDLLLGLYSTARNVRLGPSAGEWGSVVADYTDPQSGRERPIYASIQLFCRIGTE